MSTRATSWRRLSLAAAVLLWGASAATLVHGGAAPGPPEIDPPSPAPAGVPTAPPQEASEEVLEAGRLVYEDQCASCHGPEGKGDGPAAGFLDPPPRDLTSGEWRYAEGGTAAAIEEVVRNGVDDTGMTPFSDTLSEEQIEAVALYVVHVIAAAGSSGLDSGDGTR